ncbi:NAD(P)-dependent dehydrogenase (short-subunit alcohol dehydrogenase family) [Nonomuraea thailandensis]|uniref:Probable oxidoreductase n=1 Tax=Nonomuraea thailandensis TaxID=1188745 RepID=A0A9X2K436_9ACTN|nr:SDR family NAD(P)-dependent oxidoreductase [Nonomuraea thailandensis]MCP2360112.1 NAD(P)-dependent dehydrogenase (short-subunit alcohol dehydrogenase family) [Nonomuraea thailandensis]
MTLITTPFNAKTTAAEILAGVDLTGRRIIVTGGASGIGLETVRALRGAGAEVTVATRNPGDGERALDLSDLASVRSFVAGWSGPVHALVANAGIMALPALQVAANGWELQLATNFLGHFALITGLRDNLRQAGGARVVTVSSGAQLRAPFDFDDPHFERRPYDPWDAYAQSKTADVLLAVGLARRWAADGIAANSFEPGYVHTNLQRHIDDDAKRALGIMDDEGNLLTPDHFTTQEQGAATAVLLAASPLVEGVTGRYFSHDNQEAEVVQGGPGVMTGVAAWSVDPAAADRLWDYAAEASRG